jgi:hypothetical protein
MLSGSTIRLTDGRENVTFAQTWAAWSMTWHATNISKSAIKQFKRYKVLEPSSSLFAI